MSNIQILKKTLATDSVKNRFQEILGKKSAGFMTSIINVVNSSSYLQKCEPNTILGAAAVAAALDLPIDNNLGFAYIIPYGKQAQFQLGYKGFLQLALRSGQFLKINVIAIYEGQLKNCNPLTEEYQFDFTITNTKIIGYVGYMKLINGFEKTVYWSLEKLLSHGKRFSKSYNSLWGDTKNGGQDAMCQKTVLKLMLAKYAPMSIEMQTAHRADQAIIKDIENIEEVEYIDNEKSEVVNSAADFLSGDSEGADEK